MPKKIKRVTAKGLWKVGVDARSEFQNGLGKPDFEILDEGQKVGWRAIAKHVNTLLKNA